MARSVDRQHFLRFAIALLFAVSVPILAHAKNFKWANNGDIISMDPYTRLESFQLSFLGNIYEPLIRRDANLKLEPALALKWDMVSPTLWRFTLRPGVKWQDGTDFTADDVVFSAARVRHPNSMLKSMLGPIKDVRKIDALIVEFETAKPDPIFPQEITAWFMMSRAWCEQNHTIEPINQGAIGAGENFAIRNTMGTGPFRLVLREPDRRTVIEANPGWWDKVLHNLDRVELDIISNAATRVAALLSGDVDMIYSVPPQDEARIRTTAGLKLIVGPELRTIFLGMDQSRDVLLHSSVTDRNPLRDRRVREAFALVIDEEAIAARIMRGQAHPTWQMWGPGINGYDASLDTRPKSDPVRAKALMTEAGYPNGFTLGMDCPNDRYENDEAICTSIAAMLARIGVRIDLMAQTKARYFNKIGPPKYDTGFYMLGWTPSTYDAHNTLYNLIVTRMSPAGEGNNGGYSNPAIDALADQMAVETDAGKRIAMIREAAVLLQKDVGYIPLHQQVVAWAAKANIDLVQIADNSFPLRLVQVK